MMPASEGGEARNHEAEVEAAMQRVRDEGNLISVSGAGHIRALIEWAESVTAALDAPRRSPEGEDHERARSCPVCGEKIPYPDRERCPFCGCVWSQGEGHEAGIAAATGSAGRWGGVNLDNAQLDRFVRDVVAAYLSRCPSPDLAAWLRSDEAERVRIEAERDEIPPEDALAHAWEQLHGCPSPDRDTEKEN